MADLESLKLVGVIGQETTTAALAPLLGLLRAGGCRSLRKLELDWFADGDSVVEALAEVWATGSLRVLQVHDASGIGDGSLVTRVCPGHSFFSFSFPRIKEAKQPVTPEGVHSECDAANQPCVRPRAEKTCAAPVIVEERKRLVRTPLITHAHRGRVDLVARLLQDQRVWVTVNAQERYSYKIGRAHV